MMSEEMQLSWTYKTQTFPALLTMKDNAIIKNDPILHEMVKQAGICRGRPPEDALRAIRNSISINLENVLAGNITPEDAIIKMQEDAVKIRLGINDSTAATGAAINAEQDDE